MAIAERKRTCFVVMPFGEKKDADGEEIDFDDIYRFFFRKAIEGLGLECIRCDEIAEAGSIHEKMFEHIYRADVVVVDITSSNANVFYELGVRHALAKSVTVLIRRKGTTIPFNIQGLQVVEYDQKKFASIERAKERITEIIKNGLKVKKNDSPVHAVLCLNIGTQPRPIGETKTITYPLVRVNKAICLITGDLQNVKDIDVWVNSENTNMQMARPLENSISGIIRYLGSKKDNGKLKEDTIAIELSKEMGGRDSASPGEIIVTSAGALAESHRVKKIFHAAAVIGQVGKGYFPIPDVSNCVTTALKTADSKELADQEITSILFPLMGTGVSSWDFDNRVDALLDAAIDYLISNPQSKLEKVCFLNYSDRELDVCQRLLEADPKVAPVLEEKTTADVKPTADFQPPRESGQDSKAVQAEGPKPELAPAANATISESTVTTIIENKETKIVQDEATIPTDETGDEAR